jgi:hypothetical protein
MITLPEATRYSITKFINKVYGAIGQKKTADEAINNIVNQFMAVTNMRSKKVLDFNLVEYPTTGTHNVCVRVAVLHETGFSFTTNLFIKGITEAETVAVAADTGVKSLCRQIGTISGIINIFYIIIGTHNFDKQIFSALPVNTDNIQCALVQLKGESNSFQLDK